MGKHRLSRRAKRDLDGIYEYGFRTFGEYQADAYHNGLERTFGLLADFPKMAPLLSGATRETRRFRFQAHIILYREERNGVVILAIPHQAQDWRRNTL